MAAATLWERIEATAERRLPALTRLKRAEVLPVELHRHRIYVLPTRFGFAFGAMLMVMLLGALNFNNNPALLLTFLLIGATLASLFHTFRSIRGLRLETLRAEPVFAGATLHVRLSLRSADGRARQRLRLGVEDQELIFDLAPEGGELALELPARQRGWQRLPRLRLWTEYPLGLFWAWSWINPDWQALVYPRAEPGAPALPFGAADAATQTRRAEGEDLHSLRDYRPSDPTRLIAWKASARHDRLLVREFEQRAGREITLDYNALAGLEREARLCRMTRWVLMAQAQNLRWELRLPQGRFGPGHDAAHLARCLRELALYPSHG